MTSSSSLPMVSPLRQRMIDDMRARKLGRHSERSHIHSCKRFAAFLERSPATATADDVRAFQLSLIKTEGLTICNRNRIMTGVKFLLKVTLRRHDLAAEIYHLKEPQKVPVVLSQDEVRLLLASAPSLKARVMLTISYACGLRAGEVTRLTVGAIDKAQDIIRVIDGKGRKDRNVMLPPDVYALLRQWWMERLCSTIRFSIMARMSDGTASYPARISANCVSPPLSATTRPDKKEYLTGVRLKESSVCHRRLPRLFMRRLSPASSGLLSLPRLDASVISASRRASMFVRDATDL